MLRLPDVTLVCVDTRTPEWALKAMRRCMAAAAFGDAVLFTAADCRLQDLPAGLRLEPLEIASTEAYSEFMLKGMLPHIHTSHLLVVQWDGFLADPAQWTDDFLQYDYIGAPWRKQAGDLAVGNGGFSLRSRRLLEALMAPEATARHPEDACICHDHRAYLEQTCGLRLAPRAVADRFAFEKITVPLPTFGFHGFYNFPHVFDEAALRDYLDDLPDVLAAGGDARDLGREMIRRGYFDLVDRLVAQRRRRLGWDSRGLRLQAENVVCKMFRRLMGRAPMPLRSTRP